jgi:hypothetical protein
MMSLRINFVSIFLCLVWLVTSCANARTRGGGSPESEITKLENPMSVQYLKQHLLKTQPRLVLNPTNEKILKEKLKSDPVVQNLYKAIQSNAEKIQQKPLLERKLEGRRLLGVSREMLYRINMLGMVYRMEKSNKILKRINEEVVAVCNFKDWNPSHFLDVAEMSMAVALALDWTAGKLPKSTIDLAVTSLIEKGIKPSYNEKENRKWVRGTNNWNQVCNGGMIAASIAIAERDPELAAKTISRSLDGIPYAMQEYAPDGVYPEGSTYWAYGTSFTVVTSAMLESAFGTDFGLADYPAFKKSAMFRVLMNTPSGWYYNYADCGDKRSESGDVTLAWFATKTGNKAFFERERFLIPTSELGELSRVSGVGLVWISQFKEKEDATIPTAWKGDGPNPIVIFTGGAKDPRGYYFGGKGGRGTTSHGNMDAGSFIFELDSVRWSIDPGNQNYNAIEQAGFDLWGNCQDCQRWILLTKNNFGHSTVTVNNALFVNNGFASLKEFKEGALPEATFDMTAVYGENLKSASRRFLKEDNKSILIEDKFAVNKSTQSIVWQMMTTADVEVVSGGAILRKDGKQLKLDNLTHPELTISVISLDPPPFYLDRKMEGLKRIEIRLPAWLVKNGEDGFKVRLSAK